MTDEAETAREIAAILALCDAPEEIEEAALEAGGEIAIFTHQGKGGLLLMVEWDHDDEIFSSTCGTAEGDPTAALILAAMGPSPRMVEGVRYAGKPASSTLGALARHDARGEGDATLAWLRGRFGDGPVERATATRRA